MTSNSRTLTLTGTLDQRTDSEPSPKQQAAPGPEEPLAAAVAAVRSGQGDMTELLEYLRSATVWVEAIPTEQGRAVQWFHAQGLSWLPAFTSLERMAEFFVLAGRGESEQPVHYGQLTGAELLEECLPQLPRGTGVVLDAGSEHVLALPPVRGIVAEELVITPDDDTAEVAREG